MCTGFRLFEHKLTRKVKHSRSLALMPQKKEDDDEKGTLLLKKQPSRMF